ncbi:hypothetical protein BN2537_4601 [Streptomyces venezuelae]|nr:hypothetical protein BN2537_4601 [Streptomyces venezuelae]
MRSFHGGRDGGCHADLSPGVRLAGSYWKVQPSGSDLPGPGQARRAVR